MMSLGPLGQFLLIEKLTMPMKRKNEKNADLRARRERSSPFRSTLAPALAALGPLLREGLRFFE